MKAFSAHAKTLKNFLTLFINNCKQNTLLITFSPTNYVVTYMTRCLT